MNQPIEDRIKKIEEKQEDTDKRLAEVERRTEPIPATTRIEVASADVLNQLKALEEGQKELLRKTNEKLDKIAQTQASHDERFDRLQEDTNVVKIQMEGVRADVLRVAESQADFRDRLIEHGQVLKAIQENQDRHTETLSSLISSAESHDALLKNVATKDDIASMATKDNIKRLETDITSIKTTQEQILALLKQNRPES